MAEQHHPVPAVLVDCIARARAPSVQELDSMAERIWTESSAQRSAFAWGQLEPSSDERIMALRAALAAVNGSQA